MRRPQVRGINQPAPTSTPDPVLVFTKRISPVNGTLLDAMYQPDKWDQVRRIDANLFLAWNDGEPDKGTVYLGEWKPEKTETDSDQTK